MQPAAASALAPSVYCAERGLTLDGYYTDPSAESVAQPFLRREQGKELVRQVKVGDAILFAGLPVFRDATDGLLVLRWLQRKGVAVHFAAPGMDSEEHGRLLLGLMEAAVWQQEYKSRPIKAGLARRRAAGLPVNQNATKGYGATS